MKKIFLGIMIGAAVTTAATALAAQFEVVPNPYKILVNGQEAAIAGYNIEGSTYFKLRDIGAKVGFDVNFEDETIKINSKTAALPNGAMGPQMEGNQNQLKIVAGVLGISESEVSAAIQAGTSLGTQLNNAGLLDTFKAVYLADLKENLAAEVSGGKMDQTMEDQIYSETQTAINAWDGTGEFIGNHGGGKGQPPQLNNQ